MSSDEEQRKRSSYICCHMNIRGISATRIILWLVAITIVSFVIGLGILALYGGFPPSTDHPLTPFRNNALLTPNTTVIPLDGATSGDVRLTLGAGDLTIQGGAPDAALMEATVFTEAGIWQPNLALGANASQKSVTITEKGHKGKALFAVDSPNRWEIRLRDTIPIRLEENVGAGDNTLRLGTLNLETLAVHTGAGDTTVDLSGYHGGRFDGTIKIGVGDLTLRIPRTSNTRIQVHQGIGDITENGFIRHDDTYITAGFNSSIAVNQITLNQGVGSITLETV